MTRFSRDVGSSGGRARAGLACAPPGRVYKAMERPASSK